MTRKTSRSEAVKKAVETRKRNWYQAMRDNKIQSARREYLYNKLTDEQREAIEQQLDASTYGFDDELEEFVLNKEHEVVISLRTLLRNGIHPALILLAFDAGRCSAVFPTDGFAIDKKKLLDEVLHEEEFRSVDTDIDEDEVDGINYEDFDIPAVLDKKGGAIV